jgi:hypothetical protein
MTKVRSLAAYSTATVSDALDKLGRPGSMLGLAPLFDGARLCGRAFTVRYVATGSPPGTVGDYLDDVAPGEVVVLDNGGRVDCTVWATSCPLWRPTGTLLEPSSTASAGTASGRWASATRSTACGVAARLSSPGRSPLEWTAWTGSVPGSSARAGRRVRTSASGDTRRECIRPRPPRKGAQTASELVRSAVLCARQDSNPRPAA